jgi:hypothetical protein
VFLSLFSLRLLTEYRQRTVSGGKNVEDRSVSGQADSRNRVLNSRHPVPIVKMKDLTPIFPFQLSR